MLTCYLNKLQNTINLQNLTGHNKLLRDRDFRKYRKINSSYDTETLSSLRQNKKRANSIDQNDNASVHTARLTVNFHVANIIFVLGRPPLPQDMSAIKLLIATLKSKGIAI